MPTICEGAFGMYRRFVKRALDFAASLCGVIVLSPVLLVLALWVKLDSKGPVLFRQKRVLYSHPSGIIKMCDIILFCKFAALFGLGCGLNILIWDKMIHHQRYFIF